MALSEFEERKIEKIVGSFIEKRRPPPSLRKEVDFGYRLSGQNVEIFEIRPVFMGKGKYHEMAVARARYVKTQRVWKLYWQRQDLRWHIYQPLPQSRSLERVIEEIDVDPYGCFWG